MLENRPIVSITIGYVIGILIGLYLNISIAFFYLFIFIAYLLLKKEKKKKFKLLSIKRYIRYIKIIITKNVFIIIIISSIFSNSMVIYLNNKYINLYQNLDEKNIIVEAVIVSNVKEKEYKDVYKIKVININSCDKYKNTYLYLNVNKKVNLDFKYGDKIKINGVFEYPNTRKNYKGFDYREYLKSIKILGSVNLESVENLEKSDKFSILKYSNNIFLDIKKVINDNYEKDIANVILSIAFGYTEELEEKIKDNFLESNLADVLAVSGTHINYLIIFIKFVFEKLIGKKYGKIIMIIVLIGYMLLAGFSQSVVRATVMAIVLLIAEILNRKSDIWQNISLALLILLIHNPFSIENVSTILTFAATIGIICKISKSVTISATIVILPIIVVFFNKIYITSFLISLIIGVLIAIIVIGGLLFIVFYKLLELIMVKEIYIKFLDFIVNCVINLAEFGSQLPYNKIDVITPSIISVIIYYVIVFIGLFLYRIYKAKNPNSFQKRVRNIVALIKFRFRQYKNKIINLMLVLSIIVLITNFIPHDLKIYFIDVGQGDACFIKTPNNKTVLIDGGGTEVGDFDVGKNILLPYLLDRKVRKIDYIFISHFDTDHCEGILYIMDKIKINNIIIGKQFKQYDNYKEFIQIAKEKKININILKSGQRIYIDKNIFFDILWPDEENMIFQNSINNNSLVCKLNYKNFSMLFTGDIEEISEKMLISKYEGDELNSTVLKVAHHGSKTSSIESFLEKVKPKIAVIGVGENNNFGHPSYQTIQNLEKYNIDIYRTDLHGEITIKTDGNMYKISNFVNNKKNILL